MSLYFRQEISTDFGIFMGQEDFPVLLGWCNKRSKVETFLQNSKKWWK